MCYTFCLYNICYRFEDCRKNAMHESILLFSELFESKWLRRGETILLLNKHDLFCQSLLDTPLSICFSEKAGWTAPQEQWTGPNFCDFVDYSDYLKSLETEELNQLNQMNEMKKTHSILQLTSNNENENENNIDKSEEIQNSSLLNSDNNTSVDMVGNDYDKLAYTYSDNPLFDNPLFVECHRKALTFIARQYELKAQQYNDNPFLPPKALYTFVVTATDTNSVERVCFMFLCMFCLSNHVTYTVCTYNRYSGIFNRL